MFSIFLKVSRFFTNESRSHNVETKYLGHITVNGKVYLFLKENRKINFFRVNERFFSSWLVDDYSVYLSIDHDFFLYFVVNLSCISSSDSFSLKLRILQAPVSNTEFCALITRTRGHFLLFAAVLRIAAHYCFHGSSLLTAFTETWILLRWPF